jgi:hypothetical protein
MTTRFLLSLALFGAATGSIVAQSSPLDLIPANAAAAVVIRHPEELRKKGDEFLKATEMNFGLRPTEALDLVKMFLGINQGLDMQRPSAAVLLRPEDARNNLGLEDLPQSLYFVLAFTDLDTMAANFGFDKGELKPGVVTKVKNQNQPFGHSVLARGKHLHMAGADAPLQRLLKGKAVVDELSVGQLRTFGSADLLIHVNPKALGQGWNELVKMVEAELGKVDEPQEREIIEQFVKTLESLRFALAGVRVTDGLGINLLTTFPKDGNDAARRFIDSLRARRVADLKALPEGKVVAAQAYAGDSDKNAVFARAFIKFLLKDFLEAKHITSATDRPSFLSVFNEVWQRLEGSRIAAYLTRDESRLGLFSLVAILDTPDASRFLVELRTLAKIADGTLDLTKSTPTPEIEVAQLVKDLSAAKYQVRASATTRLRLVGEPALGYLEKAVANPPDLETLRRAQRLLREISAVAAERRKELLAEDLPRYLRPTFAFVTGAETRAGLPVDIIRLKLAGKDAPAARQMQQLFGPDWDKLRLAVHGKQVVVLLGSEVELFETALVNLRKGKPGLAASKTLEEFARMQTPQAAATFHLSVESLLGLVNGQPRQTRIAALTSFALTAQDTGLQLDMYLPVADIRAIGKQRMP